jgi:hypothetical protein
VGEVKVVFFALMGAVIIFLEGKLFRVGQSVFGLFSVVTLCLTFIQAYQWVIVQVKQCLYVL